MGDDRRELSTVADDEAVVHDGSTVLQFDSLAPSTTYELGGFTFDTLPRPGELLTTFATVNDVHFGETECGIIEGLDGCEIFRSEPGEDPYPLVMNRAAVAEMAAVEPAAVVVKGDLTSRGTLEEYAAFLDCYEPVFGDRLHHVRGNHDAYWGEDFASTAPFDVTLPGVTLAVIDTTVPTETPGRIAGTTLDWLDELAARADRPVLVFGHHPVGNVDAPNRPDTWFGLDPDSSAGLVEVVARRASIRGYFAGHTHRNRVQRFRATGDVRFVEVACVKDFPGSWAEYRVFDGGILQIHRRVSAPEALVWTDKTRAMYGVVDYVAYAFGSLDDRCFAIPTRGAS